MIAAFASGTAATAQPCNPVIDGTYCAEQMPKRTKPSTTQRPSAKMPPIQGVGRDNYPGYESPATLGGITFGNTGTRCVGLLRRGKCE